MPALDRNLQVTFENCGTSVTMKKLSRHKLRCSGWTLYCPKNPNFSTTSKDDLNYHTAKKHSVPRSSITYKCELCHAEFNGFYALRQHKSTQYGTQSGFGANKNDVEDIVGNIAIKVWEKNWNLANTFCQILNWRMENTESSTLSCHPSTFPCSTINRIMYSKSWNVLQKLTLQLDSFWKIMRMERADTFMLTRTIQLPRSQNLCVHQTILLTWKRNYRKWILLIFVHKRKPISNGSFTNWQM